MLTKRGSGASWTGLSSGWRGSCFTGHARKNGLSFGIAEPGQGRRPPRRAPGVSQRGRQGRGPKAVLGDLRPEAARDGAIRPGPRSTPPRLPIGPCLLGYRSHRCDRTLSWRPTAARHRSCPREHRVFFNVRRTRSLTSGHASSQSSERISIWIEVFLAITAVPAGGVGDRDGSEFDGSGPGDQRAAYQIISP